MPNQYMTLGQEMKKRRKALGWSPAVLSEKSGADLKSIYALENRDSEKSKYEKAIRDALDAGEASMSRQEPGGLYPPEHIRQHLADRPLLDPVLSALAYLDEITPARANLFRAQILAAEEDARREQHSNHRSGDVILPKSNAA